MGWRRSGDEAGGLGEIVFSVCLPEAGACLFHAVCYTLNQESKIPGRMGPGG
jgi:hypothetical protein